MEFFAFFGCFICFLAGAAVVLVTQRLMAGGTVSELRQANKAQARMRVILQNVEAYNGTGDGQKELPNH